MADIKKLTEQLVGLTVKEVAELIKELKDVHGIEPVQASVVAQGAAPEGGAAGADQAEKAVVDLVLKSYGASKLAVIKEVKNQLGLGLKEAKDLVSQAPQTIKEGINREEANKVKAKLEAVGAEVELK